MSSLIDRIKELEKASAALSPNREQRQEVQQEILELGDQFLDDLPDTKVYNADLGEDKVQDHPIGTQEPLQDLLELLGKEVDLPGINAASGRHLGYIPGGGIYLSSLGDYLAAVYNKFAGVYFAGPGAVRLENELIRWMGQLIGYEKGLAGNLTSGGSIASLIAIVTARDAHQIKGRDTERAVIYTSEQVHHCLHKAIRIAGMGEAIVRQVELDDHHRIKASELSQSIDKDRMEGLKPWMVIASAGTTDTGAIDPLDEIGKVAKENNLWLHVDAAYGGFFLLCPEFKDRLKGIDNADSVVMDPHKGLFLPYGIGAVLIKDGQKLYQSHNHQANYMQDTFDADEELSPADLSPELSKHFRGLRMWLPLKLYGLEPFRACLEEKVLLARYFYEKLGQDTRFEMGPYPDLSVCYFRFLSKEADPDIYNRRLAQEIQQDGRVFLSTTIINSRYVIRMAILSFRTHLREVDMTLEIIQEKVSLLENKGMK